MCNKYGKQNFCLFLMEHSSTQPSLASNSDRRVPHALLADGI